jgi:hypothetical protein
LVLPSISADGQRIAVSAPDRSNDSVGVGYVKIYDLESIRQEARLLAEELPQPLRGVSKNRVK